MLRVLAHPCRLKIIELLEMRGEAPVHAIMEWIQAPQSATSQHLRQMQAVGLLAAERKGKEVWYRIEDRRSLSILHCIQSKNVREQ